jgi:hypothetical protein
VWLARRAAATREVSAPAHMDVFTASLKDNHNSTVMVICTVFLSYCLSL